MTMTKKGSATELLEAQADVSMSEKIAVFVPTDVNGQAVDNTRYVNELEYLLSTRFGGATAYDVSGSYLAPFGAVIHERVTVVYAYAEEVTTDDMERVILNAKRIKRELKQECVGVEYNGKFYLI